MHEGNTAEIQTLCGCRVHGSTPFPLFTLSSSIADGAKMIFIQFFQKWPASFAHDSSVKYLRSRNIGSVRPMCPMYLQLVANEISRGQKRLVYQFYAPSKHFIFLPATLGLQFWSATDAYIRSCNCDRCPRVRLCDAFPWAK